MVAMGCAERMVCSRQRRWGDGTGSYPYKEEVHIGDALSNMLDYMDYDTLHLNIQAFFQILSCLEMGELLPAEGKGRVHDHGKRGHVDISMYKHRWKLGGR